MLPYSFASVYILIDITHDMLLYDVIHITHILSILSNLSLSLIKVVENHISEALVCLIHFEILNVTLHEISISHTEPISCVCVYSR